MVDEVQDMKELMEELRSEERLTREQAFAIYGRISTMYEFGIIDGNGWDELRALIPLTVEEVRDIRL